MRVRRLVVPVAVGVLCLGLAVGGFPVAAQGRELRSGDLTARRGLETYIVLYESGPALEGGDTHVAVHLATG